MKLKNGMDLLIKKAIKEDAKNIIDYLNIIGGESENLLFGANEFNMTVESEEEFIEDIAKMDASALFVGRVNDEIVCIGSIMAYQKERIAHNVDLAISVKKTFWRLGVGTHLMQTMIDFARKNGTTEVLHLGVKDDNVTAQKLYNKMGFEEIGRYKNFFKIEDKYYDEILINSKHLSMQHWN